MLDYNDHGKAGAEKGRETLWHGRGEISHLNLFFSIFMCVVCVHVYVQTFECGGASACVCAWEHAKA